MKKAQVPVRVAVSGRPSGSRSTSRSCCSAGTSPWSGCVQPDAASTPPPDAAAGPDWAAAGRRRRRRGTGVRWRPRSVGRVALGAGRAGRRLPGGHLRPGVAGVPPGRRPGRPTPSWCWAPPSTTGGPRPCWPARLDHALELWRRGPGPGDRGHRRQAARRPLHRGDRLGQLPHRAGRARRRPSSGRSTGATRGSRWRPPPASCTTAAWLGGAGRPTRTTPCASQGIADEVGLDAAVSPTDGSASVQSLARETAAVAARPDHRLPPPERLVTGRGRRRPA